MARIKDVPGPGANPDVRFERGDVEYRAVVWFAIVLAGCGIVVHAAMLWYGSILMRQPHKDLSQQLPPAAADKERRAPPIPLEGLEDVRERAPRLRPPRAADYYQPQEQALEKGGGGAEPIDRAIKELAGKLPVRKEGRQGEVTDFSRRLPSKAASGWVETGGQ